VAERLKRKWVCAELAEIYLKGALGRFTRPVQLERPSPGDDGAYYRVPRPGLLWNGDGGELLPNDGGRKRPILVSRPHRAETIRNVDPDAAHDLAAKTAAE
jgi:hypothetical protein